MSREIYFSRDFSTPLSSCRVLKTGFLFCAILIFTDLTKIRVGGILKEREKYPTPSVVSTLWYKAVQCIANVWAALLFNSFYFLGKKGLSE